MSRSGLTAGGLLLVAVVAICPWVSAQTGGTPVEPVLPSAPGMDATLPRAPVHITVDSVHHRVIVTAGPYHLPPMDMDGMMSMDMGMGGGHAAHGELLLTKFQWPNTDWLRGFKVEILDRDGHLMPQRTMHHMEFINYDRRQLVYPLAERVLGVGEETAPVVLPRSVGVPVDKGMHMGVYLMWNNDTGHDLDGIYYRLTLICSPANTTPRPLAALPFKVDINSDPGMPDSYDVPPGGRTRVYNFTIPVSGRLLGVGGHLHDFGAQIRLEDVRTGKVLAHVQGIMDKTGHELGVSHQLLAIKGRGPHLRAGHPYRLVAVYINPTKDTLRAVMAVMGGLFAPDDIRDWPKIDYTNPDYLHDIAVLLRQASDVEVAESGSLAEYLGLTGR
ncbi:MAG: hypothetical protein ACREL5_00010 [Gemmatimonadales bacterium]